MQGANPVLPNQAPPRADPARGFYFGRSIFLILLCSVFGAFNREPYDRWGVTAILCVSMRGWSQGSVVNSLDVIGSCVVLEPDEHTPKVPVMVISRGRLGWSASLPIDLPVISTAAADCSAVGDATGSFCQPRWAILVARTHPTKIATDLILPDRRYVGDVFIVPTAFVAVMLNMINLDTISILTHIGR